MIYMTTAATYTLGKAFGVRVTINKPTTGTVTINDGGTPIAVIAASTAASGKDYWGFNGVITLVNASAEDITVNTLNHQP